MSWNQQLNTQLIDVYRQAYLATNLYTVQYIMYVYYTVKYLMSFVNMAA